MDNLLLFIRASWHYWVRKPTIIFQKCDLKYKCWNVQNYTVHTMTKIWSTSDKCIWYHNKIVVRFQKAIQDPACRVSEFWNKILRHGSCCFVRTKFKMDKKSEVKTITSVILYETKKFLMVSFPPTLKQSLIKQHSKDVASTKIPPIIGKLSRCKIGYLICYRYSQ